MKKNHDFNFSGGDILTKIGASWFASYWNYSVKGNKTELRWKNYKTSNLRIAKFKKSYEYHSCWREQILKMDDSKLSNNKLGIKGAEVKKLIR